jgi:hypothetical protein
MANDSIGLRGNAGTPTTRLPHGPYPAKVEGVNPANSDPTQRQVDDGTSNAPAHEGAQAASTSVRLGHLRALHAAAFRQKNHEEWLRLGYEIDHLEREHAKR